MPKLTNPKESSTRKKIDTILNNLGWKTDETSPNCNAFTERCKTVEQNKLLCGNEPDYVLYESGTDRPIAIVESKNPAKSSRPPCRKPRTSTPGRWASPSCS